MSEAIKDIAYYMSLPYSVRLYPPYGEVKTWFAEIPELAGCMTYGDSREEVLSLIEDAKRVWIEGSLAYGDTIPEPEHFGQTD
jgi:antitoxin HicB